MPARASRAARAKKVKVSRLHPPEGMPLEQWQIELRRQFGREQTFHLKNLGEEAIFSDFEVSNPQTGRTYRVRIRGLEAGQNFCTCGDFATNALGTCKHVEFTLGRLQRKRGGVKQLEQGFEPPYSEIFLHYGGQRAVCFRPGSECAAALVRLACRTFGDDGRLLPGAAGDFDRFLEAAQKIEPDLVCNEDALGYLAEVRDAERRAGLLREAFPRGAASAAFKQLLKTELYDYQRQGALFAAKAGRCLIGDEMGLGKTIQAIAAAEIMARQFGIERVLVVCPTSLKYQWQSEIEKFCGRAAGVIGGLRPLRESAFGVEHFFKIINYDTVHSDLDLITRWAPDLVILDEAQRIKNWATRTARSVKRIETPYAIVLTGTPLENRLEELLSIVQFVDRHRLGPTFRLLHDHQIRDEFGKVVGYKDLGTIGKTLEPILIRRRKDQVLAQLPERIINTLFVPMTPKQRVIHAEAHDIVIRLVAKWRRYKFLSEADQRRLLCALQTMRMSCDSSFLCGDSEDHGNKADEAIQWLDELFEQNGGKVVLFSQWLGMHEVLLRRIRKRGWGHVLFHGGVPGRKRGELIARFRDDPRCKLFLSTDAGGVGLNLQFASNVLNLDLPWNPAVLEQRIGRVHRLGQKRPVRVVNFVAQGTIEEGMLQVLQFKKSLFAGVLDGGESNVMMGGSRLNRFMETVEAASGSIPPNPPEEPAVSPEPTKRRAAKSSLPADEEDASPRAETGDAWSGLLNIGLKLIQEMAAPRQGRPSLQIDRDAATGNGVLKIPLPKAEILDQALTAVQSLLERLRT